MSLANDSTTLVCLFHHDDQARAALQDLTDAGVPQSSVSTLGGTGSGAAGGVTLQELGIPARDLAHLQDGLRDGGTIISVAASAQHVSLVERIFGDHRAEKVDEYDEDTGAAPLAAAGTLGDGVGERTIPIVEEELNVGKRTVDQGGVRVYRRVVEIPVEESVNLREEHVVVERNPVDRPATAADLSSQGRSVELTETAEEAVVGKTAYVTEEVLVGKQVGQRTEHIQDTVRRTEVEVEDIAPSDTAATKTTRSF